MNVKNVKEKMKQKVEVLKDSFTDFAGKVHYYIMAAVSEEVDAYVSYNDDYNGQDCAKGLKFGISICNPDDVYVEEVGMRKAIGKAKNANSYALLSSELGQINTKLVQAFLQQESEFFKNNPEKYIKGYNEQKEKYLKEQEMNKIKESMTDEEFSIATKLKSNPHYLDNIIKYVKWICRKSEK